MDGTNATLRDASSKMNAEDLFKALKRLEESSGITENQAKEIAAKIIDVLKEHELTYRQAHEILIVAGETLNTMSQLLNL